MPFSRQFKQKLIEFNRLLLGEEVKAYDPVLAGIWTDFLRKAYQQTRSCYGDVAMAVTHIEMVRMAGSFRKELATMMSSLQRTEADSPSAVLYQALRRTQPASELQLIGNLGAIGLPQHTAAQDIIRALDFQPTDMKAEGATSTPVPSSGFRSKEPVPSSVRRPLATAG